MSGERHPRRAYVETYGCQMNISDGELMEGILEQSGYRIVSAPEDADVVLVNTCAIREHAEQRVLGRVNQLHGLKRERPDVVLGVTGCMAQRMGSTLLEKVPHVDLVMGPDGYRGLPEALDGLGTVRPAALPGDELAPPPSAFPSGGPRKGRRQLAVLDLNLGENYQGLEQRRAHGASAWVAIQRGCDHRCTFCIVPYVRGPEKNRAAPEVLSEIRGLVEQGVTEVTLLGQTVNSYQAGDWGFARLLREVARVDGIRRVRFTSPHPNDVTPELIEVMATEPTVCEQLHLPVQSGNDRTLKRMLRRYTVEAFLDRVEAVRAAIPGIALSTDVIVAFPGETEEEFRDTLALLRTVRFDDAFTYRYSPRDGTPATRFPEEDFIDPDEGQRRLEELIEVSRGIQAEINQGEVGRMEEVLVEKEARQDDSVMGRTRRNKVVAFEGDPSWVGSYRWVALERTTGATFGGSLVDEPIPVAAP
ncbi:MAG: MiaB/RimO family radical SAM methylthiotransferase [Gemmatimonadota bacterium]|nr:MiaB/RimO family radical SAM methylthiotransferase [Gemmatimonadota bacterium]MDH5758375.1 MiaB/RimO family radical SAM methylthiotransferase [Gemmatimonadota bacterium]